MLLKGGDLAWSLEGGVVVRMVLGIPAGERRLNAVGERGKVDVKRVTWSET